MATHTKFRINDVQKLREDLDQTAPYEPQEVSKRDAIAMLAPEIATMQAKGYSFEMIAERLSSRGIPIRAGTLKGYLADLKKRVEFKRKGARTTRGGRRQCSRGTCGGIWGGNSSGC